MKSLSRRPQAAVAVAAVLFAAQALCQEPDRQARAWAASCAACHGTGGVTQGQAVPSLAGRDAEVLYRALVEFKTNLRPAATVMHQHAKGYSDDELRRIAQYFSRQAAK
jgi:sulfide dehydrogenase cytochrome subunit